MKFFQTETEKNCLLVARGLVVLAGLVIILLITACDDSRDASSRNVPDHGSLQSMPIHESMPEIKIKMDQDSQLSAAEKAEVQKSIQTLLENLVSMVYQKDFHGLPAIVDQKAGLYVDLKAHRKHSEIEQAVQNPESYLNIYFLHTDKLRKSSGDDEKLAVREVLLRTRSITAQISEEGNGEYELQLNLDDMPQYNYYVNNPVVLKRGTNWYVYRMF